MGRSFVLLSLSCVCVTPGGEAAGAGEALRRPGRARGGGQVSAWMDLRKWLAGRVFGLTLNTHSLSVILYMVDRRRLARAERFKEPTA